MNLMKKAAAFLLAAILLLPGFSAAPVSAETEIAKVTLTGVYAPAVKKYPDYTTVTLSPGSHCSVTTAGTSLHWEYSRNGEDWFSMNMGQDGSMAYEYGVYYRVWLMLTPDDGYAFTENTSVTLNGRSCEVAPMNGSLKATYVFDRLWKGEIGTVAIDGIGEPALDEYPDFSSFSVANDVHFSVGAAGTSILWHAADRADAEPNDWEDLNSHLAVQGTFPEGKFIRMRVVCMAEDGYRFSDNLSATLNGKPAAVEVSEEFCIIDRIFPPMKITELEKIDLSGITEPEFEKPFDYSSLTLPEGCRTDADAIVIEFSEDGKAFTDTRLLNGKSFLPGLYYRISVTVAPDKSYRFAKNASATLNGKEANIVILGEKAVISRVFAPIMLGTVGTVDVIGVARPEIGAALSSACGVPAGAGYQVAEGTLRYFVSKDGEHYEPLDSSAVFEKGKYYRVEAGTELLPGYTWEEELSGKINGNPATLTQTGKTVLVSYSFGRLIDLKARQITLIAVPSVLALALLAVLIVSGIRKRK